VSVRNVVHGWNGTHHGLFDGYRSRDRRGTQRRRLDGVRHRPDVRRHRGPRRAGCETAKLDVTEQSHVDRVVGRIVDEQGGIDCLVNNAGIAQAGALEEVPIDRLEWQFDVNVFGPHRLIRAVLPHMREQGDGTIVNVSSIAGRVAQPAMGPCTGTKHAMEGLSDALRVEVAPFGVDVVLVEPEWVQTRIGDKGEETMWAVEGEDSPYATLHENGALIKDVMLSDAVAGEVPEVADTIREARSRRTQIRGTSSASTGS